MSTTWRTETYDPPGFSGSKTGVGIALRLDRPARVDRLRLDGSANGWSASIHVVDADTLDGVDPDSLPVAGRVEQVSGPVEVDLGGAETSDRTGRLVLVWIQDLGEPVDGGRHRVEVAEISLVGSELGGG